MRISSGCDSTDRDLWGGEGPAHTDDVLQRERQQQRERHTDQRDTETERDSRRERDTHTYPRGMEKSPATVKTEQEAGRKLRAIRSEDPRTVSRHIDLFLPPLPSVALTEGRVKEGGLERERLSFCKPCSDRDCWDADTHTQTHTHRPTPPPPPRKHRYTFRCETPHKYIEVHTRVETHA